MKFLYGLLLLLIVSKANAQFVIIKTKQDDSLKCKTAFKEVSLSTEYGKLLIPVDKIRRINFAVHHDKEILKKVDDSIKFLGSNVFKERDDAFKVLFELATTSYFKLRVLNSPDLEVTKRKDLLLSKIVENYPPDLLDGPAEDSIETINNYLKGKILDDTFKFKHHYLGDLLFKISELKELIWVDQVNKTININAAIDGGKFIDSGIDVTKISRFSIISTGEVDLWPQGPGQFLATPKGASNVGRGSSFPAGALIGKINNVEFFIGDNFKLSGAQEGRLFLQIVNSSWDNASSGSYTIRIRSLN